MSEITKDDILEALGGVIDPISGKDVVSAGMIQGLQTKDGNVAFAIGAVADQGPLWIGLGAVGFAASDLSVARDRFVRAQFVNAAWGLPAYYLSQLALAFSIGQAGL